MGNTGFFSFISDHMNQITTITAFSNFTVGHLFMLIVGLFVLYLAIAKELEPILLVPIGFGILLGNIPLQHVFGVYDNGSMMSYLYYGISHGIYPSLIFLGIGAMTDFSSLISNPKLILIALAAQLGIFGAYSLSVLLGFNVFESGSIGIIGAADGPTAIFLTSRLAPGLMSAIAVSAYFYMALASHIQPPIMRMLTTKKERLIRMKSPRQVSKTEKILFPIAGMLLTAFVVPFALPLLGMFFFGNLLKESGVTNRLAEAVRGPMIDIVTVLTGLAIGASAQASAFLNAKTIVIFIIGAFSFAVATFGGVMIVKVVNLFLKGDKKINPLIGNAGVSALPAGAKVSQVEGLKYDNDNHLLVHAMGPNVAAIIGSAVAAGVLLSFLS